MWARPGARLIPVVAVAWSVCAIAIAVPEAARATAACLWGIVFVALATTAWVAMHQERHALTRTILTVLILITIATAAGAVAATNVALAAPLRAEVTELGLDDGRALAVDATVVGKVERRADDSLAFDATASVIAIGDVEHAVHGPIIVRVESSDITDRSGLDVGAVIVARGTARPAYEGSRALFEIAASRELSVVAAPSGVFALASHLRQHLVESASRLPGYGAELIPGLAIGDTALVSAGLDQAMKTSSLSHLTAVSGANCALVVGIAFLVAAQCCASRAVRVVCGLVALAGFVLIVTPEPSVVRAAAMAIVAMLGVLLARTGAGLAVLCLAVSLLLVFDPWLAASLGFALSAAATAALLVLARPLTNGLARWLPRALALALAVPLSAQLVCGPLLILIAPTVPIYGVLANLLAAPAAPVATVVGLAACLTSWAPWLQDGLVALTWLPASWIAGTARTAAELPGSSLPWAEGLWGAALLTAIGVALFVVLVGAGPRRWQRRLVGLATISLAVVAGVGGGVALLTTSVGRLTLPADWSVLACDVGQGDAILVRSADMIALVDTGPDPALLERCLTRAGVGEIDILVLTHFDTDHVGGVEATIGRTRTVLHGPATPEGALVLDDLARSGALVSQVHAGMDGALGDSRWRVLWPIAGSSAAPGNDTSVVLDVRGGGVPTMLMLGDLSAAPQQSLLTSDVLKPPYAVVKVAHHGSADQYTALYEQAAPSIALLTVGADNRYGHPRDEIVAVLDDLDAVIARTDLAGTVAVTTTDFGAQIWRDRGG
ncbi:ComEC/Rec2 family competence protein [Microbacterium marmarense]|uniref:ComEC/Rec2 family competence protein n=1 Tax=Microbacterium marmarense TaxID=3122051 RepID=A0ABU8LTJ8_9MICO